MKEHRRESFKWEDKTYEIRVLYEDSLINVVAFFNNYPANGFRYQILIPKDADIQVLLKGKVYVHLLDMAKNDILEKRWERLKEFFG
jgi:hypothetical protein